ncbi:hypothetical protein FNV43_RR01291 [Rhamnella rubrinervis]|uniref:Vesicle transport protein USE1 n=1 Tax=Rhamnella rubrinervis TaxID=2594499 RepID=A0A8K0MS55_9ROSA|nr:hypothetical protein FNV43_RR01291 [Rhamnella rubrinervis]
MLHDIIDGLVMGISKTEVNLRRLLAAAPKQQNQAKLVHYVATLREQLEQLSEERTPEGLPSVSKAVVTDYSEKIEAIASKLTATVMDLQVPQESLPNISVKGSPSKMEGESHFPSSPGLRRRSVPASTIEDKTRETFEDDSSTPVKLDAAAQAHIEKHRKLQDDLTDEMVGLARQLKERSLMMSRSVQDTEKVTPISISELILVGFESRYWILQRRLLNVAWQALVTQVHGHQKYTPRLLKPHASLGF